MSATSLEIQKHLTLARERIAELESDMFEQSERHKKHVKHLEFKYDEEWKSSRRNTQRYRFALTVLAVIIGYLGYNNMKYGAENRWFATENASLQQRFDNVLEALHAQNGRVFELEYANGQLIRHCTPRDIKRAIKATPPPPTARGV